MDSGSLDISVVVISWNQRDFLSRLVLQLLEQDFPHERYEVVVVDDGSTDGSREWLTKNASPRLRLLFGKGNRGRAASRNAGIRSACGRVVVMIDGDHTVERDFLTRHWERHLQECCAIVGKSVFADHLDFRALNHYLNGGGASKLPENERLPGRYFLTRNCSVPREVLLRIGLFDESFSTWGGEDLDLGVRIDKSSVPIYGERRALAIHHHLRPLQELMKQLFEFGREGIPHLVKKHPELLTELKLERVIPRSRSPLNQFRAFLWRFALHGFFWQVAMAAAHVGRRYHLPRLLFDYLHYRQYALGYIQYLRANQKVS